MAFSQFSTDEVIEDFLGRDIKRFYSYDNSGALISQPTLFSDIDFSSYELLSANVNFSDKNSTQKIVFSPVKLIREDLKFFEFLRGSKLNLALKDGVSTIGFAISGDNSSPFSKKSIEIMPTSFPRAPKIKDGEDYETYKKTTLAEFKRNDLFPRIIKFDKDRLKHVFKYSVGYNIQLFSILGANGSANNFDSLNSHSIKARTISASVTYARNQEGKIFDGLDITGNYNYILLRKSGAESSKTMPYTGPSVTAKKRLVRLMKSKDLNVSPDYIKSHFIPSIDFGVSFEGKYYKDNDLTQAENGIKTQEVWTFFLDFKISPSAQFRLGIPKTRTINIDLETEKYFGATLQYSLKITNLE